MTTAKNIKPSNYIWDDKLDFFKIPMKLLSVTCAIWDLCVHLMAFPCTDLYLLSTPLSLPLPSLGDSLLIRFGLQLTTVPWALPNSSPPLFLWGRSLTMAFICRSRCRSSSTLSASSTSATVGVKHYVRKQNIRASKLSQLLLSGAVVHETWAAFVIWRSTT